VLGVGERRLRQRSEQYFTSSQQFSHFFRQVNGNPQTAQVFVGKSDFLRWRGMGLIKMGLSRMKLNHVRIVVVQPAGARNLGSIARVMKNMGLTQLVIVKPECDPLGEEARQMAVHAADVLESATIVPDLVTALEGCHRVAATVGRDGVLRSVETVRSVVPWLLGADPGLILCESAIVFGREDHGLSNEDLKYAQRLVTIPANPEYQSLNLAQAVGICAYELCQGAQGSPVTDVESDVESTAQSTAQSDDPIAPFQMTEAFYLGLEEILLTIGYLYDHTADSRMQKFRLLLARSVPSTHEMTMLLGILRQAKWALRTQIPGVGSED
jgi:tRNA/rRNA methyltransferase